MFMVDDHPLPWRAPLLNGVEHANFFETRATEYSKAATRGNWNEVWDNFDRRQNAKAVAAANEDTQEGGLFDKSGVAAERSEEHTSELQSLMRISYAVFCLKKKKHNKRTPTHTHQQCDMTHNK